MGTASVRYIVDDVDAAVEFYASHLGFAIDLHPAPGFAILSRGDLRLLLNAPGAGGRRPGDRGGEPVLGGWNRFQLTVDDLDAEVARLREADVAFATGIIEGRGGRTSLVQDPAGNVIELFEPAER